MNDYRGTCDECHRNREVFLTDRYTHHMGSMERRRLRYCRECLDKLGIVLRQDGPGDAVMEALAQRHVEGQPTEAEMALLRQPDPWAHRSAKMRCATCMWYVEKASAVPGTLKIGRCRRHAPTMNGFPVIYPTDWCGDHKLDETKA